MIISSDAAPAAWYDLGASGRSSAVTDGLAVHLGAELGGRSARKQAGCGPSGSPSALAGSADADTARRENESEHPLTHALSSSDFLTDAERRYLEGERRGAAAERPRTESCTAPPPDGTAALAPLRVASECGASDLHHAGDSATDEMLPAECPSSPCTAVDFASPRLPDSLLATSEAMTELDDSDSDTVVAQRRAPRRPQPPAPHPPQSAAVTSKRGRSRATVDVRTRPRALAEPNAAPPAAALGASPSSANLAERPSKRPAPARQQGRRAARRASLSPRVGQPLATLCAGGERQAAGCAGVHVQPLPATLNASCGPSFARRGKHKRSSSNRSSSSKRSKRVAPQQSEPPPATRRYPLRSAAASQSSQRDAHRSSSPPVSTANVAPTPRKGAKAASATPVSVAALDQRALDCVAVVDQSNAPGGKAQQRKGRSSAVSPRPAQAAAGQVITSSSCLLQPTPQELDTIARSVSCAQRRAAAANVAVKEARSPAKDERAAPCQAHAPGVHHTAAHTGLVEQNRQSATGSLPPGVERDRGVDAEVDCEVKCVLNRRDEGALIVKPKLVHTLTWPRGEFGVSGERVRAVSVRAPSIPLMRTVACWLKAVYDGGRGWAPPGGAATMVALRDAFLSELARHAAAQHSEQLTSAFLSPQGLSLDEHFRHAFTRLAHHNRTTPQGHVVLRVLGLPSFSIVPAPDAPADRPAPHRAGLRNYRRAIECAPPAGSVAPSLAQEMASPFDDGNTARPSDRDGIRPLGGAASDVNDCDAVAESGQRIRTTPRTVAAAENPSENARTPPAANADQGGRSDVQPRDATSPAQQAQLDEGSTPPGQDAGEAPRSVTAAPPQAAAPGVPMVAENALLRQWKTVFHPSTLVPPAPHPPRAPDVQRPAGPGNAAATEPASHALALQLSDALGGCGAPQPPAPSPDGAQLARNSQSSSSAAGGGRTRSRTASEEDSDPSWEPPPKQSRPRVIVASRVPPHCAPSRNAQQRAPVTAAGRGSSGLAYRPQGCSVTSGWQSAPRGGAIGSFGVADAAARVAGVAASVPQGGGAPWPMRGAAWDARDDAPSPEDDLSLDSAMMEGASLLESSAPRLPQASDGVAHFFTAAAPGRVPFDGPSPMLSPAAAAREGLAGGSTRPGGYRVRGDSSNARGGDDGHPPAFPPPHLRCSAAAARSRCGPPLSSVYEQSGQLELSKQRAASSIIPETADPAASRDAALASNFRSISLPAPGPRGHAEPGQSAAAESLDRFDFTAALPRQDSLLSRLEELRVGRAQLNPPTDLPAYAAASSPPNGTYSLPEHLLRLAREQHDARDLNTACPGAHSLGNVAPAPAHAADGLIAPNLLPPRHASAVGKDVASGQQGAAAVGTEAKIVDAAVAEASVELVVKPARPSSASSHTTHTSAAQPCGDADQGTPRSAVQRAAPPALDLAKQPNDMRAAAGVGEAPPAAPCKPLSDAPRQLSSVSVVVQQGGAMTGLSAFNGSTGAAAAAPSNLGPAAVKPESVFGRPLLMDSSESVELFKQEVQKLDPFISPLNLDSLKPVHCMAGRPGSGSLSFGDVDDIQPPSACGAAFHNRAQAAHAGTFPHAFPAAGQTAAGYVAPSFAQRQLLGGPPHSVARLLTATPGNLDCLAKMLESMDDGPSPRGPAGPSAQVPGGQLAPERVRDAAALGFGARQGPTRLPGGGAAPPQRAPAPGACWAPQLGQSVGARSYETGVMHPRTYACGPAALHGSYEHVAPLRRCPAPLGPAAAPVQAALQRRAPRNGSQGGPSNAPMALQSVSTLWDVGRLHSQGAPAEAARPRMAPSQPPDAPAGMTQLTLRPRTRATPHPAAQHAGARNRGLERVDAENRAHKRLAGPADDGEGSPEKRSRAARGPAARGRSEDVGSQGKRGQRNVIRIARPGKKDAKARAAA